MRPCFCFGSIVQRFSEALEAYGEAIELDGTNMSLFSNSAAVYFEQKDYEGCIAKVSSSVWMMWVRGIMRSIFSYQLRLQDHAHAAKFSCWVVCNRLRLSRYLCSGCSFRWFIHVARCFGLVENAS